MTTPVTYGFVAYTDGSARPTNPGYAGAGIHGYLYDNQPATKGIGHVDWMATAAGYKKKKEGEKVDAVNVLHYVNIDKPLAEISDNTQAETEAFIQALTTAPKALGQYKIDKYNIISDHEGVVSGANGLLERWESLGWVKTNGQPLKQLDLKKTMLRTIRDTKSQANLTVTWVKGHSGDLGNDAADKLAAVAANRRMKGDVGVRVGVSDASGFWSMEHDRHPLLVHKTMYFTTVIADQVPGQYYMGTHGKDDRMVGSRMVDGFYAFVCLKEPDPVIEMIRDYQTQLAQGACQFVMMHLDTVVSKKVYADLSTHGQAAISRNTADRDDLWCIGDVPITRVMEPALLGYRAVQDAHDLKQLLENYQGKKEDIVETDVTEHFFMPDKKGVRAVQKTIPQGKGSVWVDVAIPGKENKARIPAHLGSSVPSRNQLKGLEKECPKVICLTWLESEHVMRYAFVIETTRAVACMVTLFTNLYSLTSTKSKVKKTS